MRFLKRVVFFLVLVCLVSYTVAAQDLLKSADLSHIKVDQLSETDIAKLQQQLKSSGLTVAQAEQLAASKGMPQVEIIKLRERLTRKETATDSQADPAAAGNLRGQTTNEYQSIEKAAPGKISVFGAQLFTTASLSFEPNLRIATPVDYILGPDDELLLNIYGVQEASFRLLVQPEGIVTIPQVGLIHVAGLPFEEASKQIKDKLARTVYRSMSTGATNMSITLGKIKSIHVTILGATKPGNYTVSSLTTLFNALYLAGGPDNNIGSYREIELIRSNKIYRTVDLYEFLTLGNAKDNVLLKEGDVINIPVYKNRVTITGQVKRPGTYEILEGENTEKLIFYAGGFNEQAYTASLKITRLTDKQRSVKDLSRTQFKTYFPGKGDEFLVSAILDKYENRIRINGAIYREGQYELTPGLTLGGLIKKADGVKPDAFLQRGLLTRTRDDQTIETIPFSVRSAINGDSDIVLKKEDIINIASIFDLRDALSVTINGEVHKPGTFLYKKNYYLGDLLFEAGGFTSAASSYRVEIARRMQYEDGTTLSDSVAQILNISTDKELNMQGGQYPLQPFDIVTVRRNPGYFEQKQVKIGGEVMYPGTYTIQSKKEKVSDLLHRAGGFTSAAYAEGVYLTRRNSNTAEEQKEKIDKATAINLKGSDSVLAEKIVAPVSKIPVNVKAILANPNAPEDITLSEGDEITVPRIDELVKVTGEVYSPTAIKFLQGQGLKYYIGRAGGFNDYARPSKTYVIYANGQVAKTRNALFGIIRTYPKIKTGTEIFIPKIVKTERKRLSTGEVVGLTSVLVSIAGVTISLINSLKK